MPDESGAPGIGDDLPHSEVPLSVRVFIGGNSGSGKTTRAWRMYLSRMPRVIAIDNTGEWGDQSKEWARAVDAETTDPATCVEAIQDLAKQGRWVITCSCDSDEFPDLIGWMIPVPALHRSPIRKLGGACLFIDEVDLVIGQGPPTKPTRTLFRRSRHVGLSIVSVTQRPSNVAKEVSAQCPHCIAMALNEPKDVEYMTDAMRWNKQQVGEYLEWIRRNPHGAVWKERNENRTLWLPDSGPPTADGPKVQLSLWRPGDVARRPADAGGDVVTPASPAVAGGDV